MKHLLKRIVAYLLDSLICYFAIMLVIQWAILSNIRGAFGITGEWFENSWNMQLYVMLTISLPVWFYFLYFDSNRAKGTFGKRVLKLSVRNLKGLKIGLPRSFFRTFLKLLPWEVLHIGIIFPTPLYFENESEFRFLILLGLVLFIFYVITIFFNSDNRAIYDRIVSTKVMEI